MNACVLYPGHCGPHAQENALAMGHGCRARMSEPLRAAAWLVCSQEQVNNHILERKPREKLKDPSPIHRRSRPHPREPERRSGERRGPVCGAQAVSTRTSSHTLVALEVFALKHPPEVLLFLDPQIRMI